MRTTSSALTFLIQRKSLICSCWIVVILALIFYQGKKCQGEQGNILILWKNEYDLLLCR